MSTDLAMVIGTIAAALAFMSLVSAYSESEPPRMAALLAVVSGSMILYAVANSPSGYAVDDVPAAFGRVLGPLIG